MPVSFGVFDDVVTSVLAKIQPESILDIGAGAGKYGVMVRDLLPSCRRIAVEIEESYIRDFELQKLYDDIRLMSAADLITDARNELFDVAIIGDCIEHLPKSTGLDLLNFLVYRTKYIIVLAPEYICQGMVEDKASEAHISVWSEQDFTWHDAWAFDNCCTMNCILLRGYQATSVSLPQLVHLINAESVPVFDFHKEKIMRRALLQLHVRRRLEIINGQEAGFRCP